VWSRVQVSIGEADTTSGDELQQRRLALIADRDVSARRRRRVSRMATVTLAVVVAGGGTAAAAAAVIATHTGQQLSGWERAAFGSGELLNEGGADAKQVMAQETADIPFPPGHDAQQAQSLASLRGQTNERITQSMARAWVARDAICTWADQWVVADNAGDSTARAQATDTLTASVSWSAVRAMDPSPNPEAGEADSRFGWVPPIAEAAQAGDRHALLTAVAQAGCTPTMMPTLTAASDYQGPR
jgi:hypothetical protein